LTYALSMAVEAAGLDVRQRALLVTTTAATMGDAYCAIAFGTKLASAAGEAAAVRALTGDDTGLDVADRALVRWARRVVRDPSGTGAEDVRELRTAGFDDRQVMAITLFVALRQAFSTVNDALGAEPDASLLERVPDAVREAVSFGRTGASRSTLTA
jgi:alkylhydroperoxidase family enzyme